MTAIRDLYSASQVKALLPFRLVSAGVTGSAVDMAAIPDEAVVIVEAGVFTGTNEKQIVTLSGTPNDPTGGTFTLTFDGETTDPIDFDAAAAAVETAVEALPNVGAGNVAVTGSAGGPWTVTFQGDLAAEDVVLMTGDATGLTGTGTDEVQSVQLTGTPTGGTFTITYAGQTTAAIAYDAAAATVQSALEDLSNVEVGDIVVTGNAGGPWTLTFGGNLAETNVAEVTASGAALTKHTDEAVAIATTVGGVAAVNEQQVVTLTGMPTGGTFTLTYAGQTTAAIAFDATAAAVDTALEALSNIGEGDVSVAGDAAGPWTVTFTGALAGTNVAEMTADGSLLTGTGNEGVTVATTVQGVAAVNEQQTVTISGAPSAGTFTLTYSGQTTGAIAFDADAATVDTALEALSNIDPGDVTVTGAAGGPWTVEFTGALAGTNVAEMTADAALLVANNGCSVSIATETPGEAFAGDVGVAENTVGLNVGGYTLTVQESDTSGGSYTNITGGAFEEVDSSTQESYAVYQKGLREYKRFIRVSVAESTPGTQPVPIGAYVVGAKRAV